MSAVREKVLAALTRVLRERGRSVPNITDEMVIGRDGVGLDSLDVAVVVVALEQELGVDPFRAGGVTVQTVGELVQLYSDAKSA